MRGNALNFRVQLDSKAFQVSYGFCNSDFQFCGFAASFQITDRFFRHLNTLPCHAPGEAGIVSAVPGTKTLSLSKIWNYSLITSFIRSREVGFLLKTFSLMIPQMGCWDDLGNFEVQPKSRDISFRLPPCFSQ